LADSGPLTLRYIGAVSVSCLRCGDPRRRGAAFDRDHRARV